MELGPGHAGCSEKDVASTIRMRHDKACVRQSTIEHNVAVSTGCEAAYVDGVELTSQWAGYGWRRISLLFTSASNNVLVAYHNSRATHATRVRAFQLVACERHRKTLTSEGRCDDENRLRRTMFQGCTWFTDCEVPPEQKTFPGWSLL